MLQLKANGETKLRKKIQSSPLMANPNRNVSKYDFPWSDLNCGESFRVEFDEIKLVTLRPLASLQSKKLGRKFRVVVHNDCFEVGRIA